MMELDPGGPPEVSFFMIFFTSFGKGVEKEHSEVGVLLGQKSFNKNTILGWELNMVIFDFRYFMVLKDTLDLPPTQDAIVAN